jgi:hypothetical protein
MLNALNVCRPPLHAQIPRSKQIRAVKCIDFDNDCIRSFPFRFFFFPLQEVPAEYGCMSLIFSPETAATRAEANHSLLVPKSLMQAFYLKDFAFMAHKKRLSSLLNTETICVLNHIPHICIHHCPPWTFACFKYGAVSS